MCAYFSKLFFVVQIYIYIYIYIYITYIYYTYILYIYIYIYTHIYNNITYQPFTKPNNELKYIDINSNYPPQTLKQLPKSIFDKENKKEIFGNSNPCMKKLYKGATSKNVTKNVTNKKM